MDDRVKTKDELLRELNDLRKENAALKTLIEGSINASDRIEGESAYLTKHFDSFAETTEQNDDKYIRQLFDDYLRMYSSRDDRLTTHFSDNFSGFTGGGDFLVKDKDEWIKITRQDFAQVKDPIRIELKDVSVQLLADTIAAATGFFTIHLPIKDHVLSRETARLVLIFRKEHDGWKISHSSISIPYYLVREGEVYPMKELTERNQLLEELIAERTFQLSEANDNLQHINKELAKEIEGHKRAEEAMLQSNRKLEAIISATPDGIGMISLDGKMQFVSAKLAEMNGYSKENTEEYIGKPAFDFIDPSSRKMLSDNIRKLLAGEKDDKLTEYLAVRKDSSRFYIDVNSTIIPDSDGKPESILFVERDITERKKAEEALLQSNQKLEAIISATPDGIGMITLDGKLQVIMSDKLPEMYGYTIEEKDEFVGRSAFDFIDPSNHQMLINNLQKLIAGEKTEKLTEYVAIKKDKSRFYIDVNPTVLFDSEGKPSGILFVERDITERKKAEAIILQQYNQLNELNTTKDKFFSIIAHDLRSPFQALLGSSELLSTEIETLTHEEIVSFSGELYNNLKNLYALLENLLTWSMMQRNMLEYKPVNIELNDLVNNIIEISIQTAAKKDISILNNVESGSRVYADVDMLRSVIQNLITNAIKFTTANGQINISSAEKNGFIEVSVHDTGIGIEKEKSSKLFNFSTLFTTKGTAGEKGTGLGLSLCKEFVERNNGKIWVESELGKGTKFTFTVRKAM